MKKIFFALLSLFVLVPSFAQERVMLDRDSLSINSHEAILVRTKDTPNKIEIDMLVPMSEPICERYETRYVLRTSSIHCGVVRERRVHYENVCVRRHPNGTCAVSRREERVAYVERARTCQVADTYCAAYGSVTDFERDGVKIKFKNTHPLTDGQEETFLIRARQKVHGGENVVYDIQPLQTTGNYEVDSKGWFGADSYEIRGR